MNKSFVFVLVLAMLSTLVIYHMPPETSQIQSLYQTKIEFQMFKYTHNRRYDFDQQAYRFKVFKDNLEIINKHNDDDTKTYKMGINHFSDMTNQEFVSKILTPNMKNMKKNTEVQVLFINEVKQAPPASVDWRDKNKVTPVKDQGSCGSCWSFSTTGAFQGAIAVKTNTLNSYSEQQLVDCCAYAKYGCEGCSGSWPQWAMQYVKDAGIVFDKDYPYTGVQDKCKPLTTPQKILDHRKPWSMLNNNTDLVKQNLATVGPLSISVDAYRWQYYYSGVYNDCHDSQINHAVLLVGYQEDGTWIVKNSWSDKWGEKGYIRIANKGSACLLKTHVIIPHLV